MLQKDSFIQSTAFTECPLRGGCNATHGHYNRTFTLYNHQVRLAPSSSYHRRGARGSEGKQPGGGGLPVLRVTAWGFFLFRFNLHAAEPGFEPGLSCPEACALQLDVMKVIRGGMTFQVSSSSLPQGVALPRPWTQSWSWLGKERVTGCAQVQRHMSCDLTLLGRWAPGRWGPSPDPRSWCLLPGCSELTTWHWALHVLAHALCQDKCSASRAVLGAGD